MPELLTAALAAIDEINQRDPNRESVADKEWPKELLYSHRMSERLAAFYPQAPDVLQIAVRAQHIARWEIPRNSYPMDRPGYQRWRKELGRLHAQKAAKIMADVGYTTEEQELVTQLLTKQGIKSNPLVQALEDVVCLVFIEHYLADFAPGHEHGKMISIIQKTWRKMSSTGQTAALQLDLPQQTLDLVQEALG